MECDEREVQLGIASLAKMDFTAFLRYSIDSAINELPEDVNSIDWRKMLLWAERQAIVGIIFDGIQKAGKQLGIPAKILFEWIGYTSQIEAQNRLLNKRCVELIEYLGQYGFDSCILKGQGNALLYDVGGKKEDGRCMALLRTPGDIDVWVKSKSDVRSKKDDVKRVIRFAREKSPKAKACYHHVDYGDFNGVEVELHYRPSFMFNPVHNNRLQKWFCKMADGGCVMAELPEGAGAIRIPNREFNIIFQLSHVYNHLLHEGIGLRQIMDYYYLLKSNTYCTDQTDTSRIGELENKLSTNTNRTNVTNYKNLLDYLGLSKIAGAVMWVLGFLVHGEGFMVHGFKSDEWMICEPDEKRGKVLLAEIMKGGNFGHYDAENQKANNAIKKNFQRIKRDMRMMRYFPSECMWEPVFRIYHYFWRLVH